MGTDSLGSISGKLLLDIKDFQAKIALATKDIQKFASATTAGISSAEATWTQSLSKIGDKLTRFGRTATIALTLPLTLFGKSAMDLANEVEVKWREVQKVYGSVAGAFERDSELIEKAVGDVAYKFGQTKVQVLETTGALAAMGYEGEDLVKMLNSVYEFAIAGQMDLNLAMESAVAISKIYNVEGEDLTNTLAMLNKVENSTGASMEDLAVAVNVAGAVAKTSGISIDEFSGYIATLRERGIDASEAANGLKTIFTRLYKVTDDAQVIYDKFGITVKDNNGNLKDGNLILDELAGIWTKLTGVEQLAVTESNAHLYQRNKFITIMEDLNSETSTYRKIMESLGDTEENVATYEKEMAIFLDTNRTKMAQAKIAFDETKIAIGGLLAEAIVPLLTKLSDLAKRFSEMDPKLQKAVVYFGMFLAVIGPVSLILGNVLKVIGTLAKGIGILIKAFSSGGMVIKAVSAIFSFLISPIGLVVLAVAALAAAAFLIYKNWDKIKEFMLNLWISILGAWQTAHDFLVGIVERISTGVVNAFNAIVTFLTVTMPNAIITFFTQTLPNALITFVTQTLPNFFLSIAATFLKGIGFILGLIIFGVPKLIDAVVTFLSELPGKVWDLLVLVYDKVSNWIVDTYEYLKVKIPEIVSSIGKWLSELPGRVWTWLVETWNKWVEWRNKLYAWLAIKIVEIVVAVVTWFAELPGRVWTALAALATKVYDRFTEMYDSVVEYLKTLPAKLLEWGENIARSFVEGFANIGKWIKEKLKDGMDSAKKWLEGQSPPVAGPFRDIDVWGFNVGKSYAESFVNGMKMIPSMLSGANISLASATPDRSFGSSVTTNNSPTINVNVGLYAGSEIEKRQIAKELSNALANYNLIEGVIEND